LPLFGSAIVIARAAGVLGVTALFASSLTTSLVSRLVIPDDARALIEAREDLEDREPLDGEDTPTAKQLREAKREQALGDALALQTKQRTQQRLAAIVANNVFCPSCRPSPPGAAAAEDQASPGLPQTQQPVALLATMESKDPLASMATILDTERDRTGVFGVNDQIRPGVFVAGISRGAVVLRTSGTLEALGFGRPEPPKPKPKPKSKPKPGSREIPGAREAITCNGNACTVDRKFVEALLANPRMLARQARLLPSVKDGETHGFRLSRVRRGTLPRLLGLKSGDTLLAVNGTNLDSMDQAISLYAKLRRASDLSLTVERKGKVFQKQLSIR
jgi:general secretion pathway protein C